MRPHPRLRPRTTGRLPRQHLPPPRPRRSRRHRHRTRRGPWPAGPPPAGGSLLAPSVSCLRSFLESHLVGVVLEEMEELEPPGEAHRRAAASRDLADDSAVTIPPDVQKDPHGATVRVGAARSHRGYPLSTDNQGSSGPRAVIAAARAGGPPGPLGSVDQVGELCP